MRFIPTWQLFPLLKDVLNKYDLDENTVALLPAGRDETNEMLRAHGYIDLIIPRGSQGLLIMCAKMQLFR